MRQAIVTRYHGPTDTRGSRISATADAGRIYVSWDHELDVDTNHQKAAEALAAKFGWKGPWIGGGMPQRSKDACVFVCHDRVANEVRRAARA